MTHPDIYFDLDGTLTDPFEGITRSVQYALEKLGLPVPKSDMLGWVIGPAMLENMARLGVSDPQEGLRFYRERFSDVGLFENTPYPGLLDVLAELQAAGHRMYLVTAKPHVFATRITAHFGIAPYMQAEFGPELDGRFNDKSDLLAHVLTETGNRAADGVFVGDRIHDFRAARANGMRSVAATWGYGNAEEWAEADYRLGTLTDLPEFVAAMRTE